MNEHETQKLRSISWREVFPFLSIFRVFRLAISAKAMLLSTAGMCVVLAGWWAIGKVFYQDGPPGESRLALGSIIDQIIPDAPRVLSLVERSGEGAAASRLQAGVTAVDPIETPWTWMTAPLRQLFFGPPKARTLLAAGAQGVWALAVWALFGGLITRFAAVRLAADENLGWGTAFRFVKTRWTSYFMAPLLPMLGVAAIVLPIAIVSHIARFGLGLFVLSIGWPLLLMAGLLMAMLLLGLLFGWPLMWATVSTEGTDGFDAISRAYAYVFQRPIHLFCYVLIATLFGMLGWLLVSEFTAGLIYLAYWAAEWGGGHNIGLVAQGGGELSGFGYAGAKMIHFWCLCAKWIAVGFLFSYFWNASSAIYFLLRRQVDATETDEVWLDDIDDDPALPPLATEPPQPVASAPTPSPVSETDQLKQAE